MGERSKGKQRIFVKISIYAVRGSCQTASSASRRVFEVSETCVCRRINAMGTASQIRYNIMRKTI